LFKRVNKALNISNLFNR